jgi:hypothetical protein
MSKERPMSYALILEFAGATADQYDAVNTIMGIDPFSGEGDWPDGLLSHTGAAGAEGGIVVFEVWDSQESQGAFMGSRLGPALDKVGLPEPSRVEWLSVLGEHHTM